MPHLWLPCCFAAGNGQRTRRLAGAGGRAMRACSAAYLSLLSYLSTACLSAPALIAAALPGALLTAFCTCRAGLSFKTARGARAACWRVRRRGRLAANIFAARNGLFERRSPGQRSSGRRHARATAPALVSACTVNSGGSTMRTLLPETRRKTRGADGAGRADGVPAGGICARAAVRARRDRLPTRLCGLVAGATATGC